MQFSQTLHPCPFYACLYPAPRYTPLPALTPLPAPVLAALDALPRLFAASGFASFGLVLGPTSSLVLGFNPGAGPA